MLDQKDIKNLNDIFKDYDYVMTTAQLLAVKLYYRDIQRMLNEGLIEKIKRGYYHWIESYGKDEIVIINRLFPDGVLCMDTALFYYKYSDRTLAEWHITIDKNTLRQRTQVEHPLIKVYLVESKLLTLGESNGEIDSQKVRIYDRDRTICDVLRNMNKMDKEIFNKAIQGYVKDPKKNIPNLMQYAKALRVQKRLKDILEVWL